MGDGNGILEWNNKFYLNIFFFICSGIEFHWKIFLMFEWTRLQHDFWFFWLFIILLRVVIRTTNQLLQIFRWIEWQKQLSAIYLTMNCMWNRIWDCFYERTVSPNNWCYTKVAANMRHILSIDKINVERLMLCCDFNHVVHITYSKWDKIRTCEVWGVVIYHVRKKRSIRHSHMYAGMLRRLDCQVKR